MLEPDQVQAMLELHRRGWGTRLEERFRRHRANPEVVRQDFESELSIAVSLRTVEAHAVTPYRRLLSAEPKAMVRFIETPPDRQLQIDFGTSRVPVGGRRCARICFLATLGYSRRIYVKVFANQRQSAWFAGPGGRSCTSAASRTRCWWTTRSRLWHARTR